MRRVDLDIFFFFFSFFSPVIEAKRETLEEHFSSPLPLPRANGNDNGGSVSQKFQPSKKKNDLTIRHKWMFAG